MYCPNCLKEIKQEDKYCNNCAKTIHKPISKLPSSTIAFGVTSVILSQTAFCMYGIIFGLIGIIFGSKCKKITKTPLALSIIGMSLSIINWVSVVVFVVGYYLFYFLYFVLLVLVLILGEDARQYPLPDQFFM